MKTTVLLVVVFLLFLSLGVFPAAFRPKYSPNTTLTGQQLMIRSTVGYTLAAICLYVLMRHLNKLNSIRTTQRYVVVPQAALDFTLGPITGTGKAFLDVHVKVRRGVPNDCILTIICMNMTNPIGCEELKLFHSGIRIGRRVQSDELASFTIDAESNWQSDLVFRWTTPPSEDVVLEIKVDAYGKRLEVVLPTQEQLARSFESAQP